MSVIRVDDGTAFRANDDEIQFQIETFATVNYVDSSISDLVDGAPGTLDTLNELAAALQDDANFASTVVLKAGSTMTGALILNADPTNALGAATKQYVDNNSGEVTLTGTETLTNKTIKNPVMRQITGDPSFGSFSGDRLQFTTNYQASWTFGSTGPAENWNTDFSTKSWQDPGNGWVNVWQLATAEDKNTFRINASNKGSSVTAGSFVTGKKYKITSLGNTTQAQWEAAGLSSTLTAAVHNVFTATGAGTGTGTADTWDTGEHTVEFNVKGADNTFTNASDMASGVDYEIYTLGDTNWNTVAGTSGVTYAVGDEITASGSGNSGTGVAIDLRAQSGDHNTFASYTSTSSTPHPTNLELQAARVSFRDVHNNHQYYFPRKDGSANQVITTDGNGVLTFQDATANSLSTLVNDQQFINGSAEGLSGSSLQDGVLTIATDNSGWDKSQLMLKDSNGKSVAITGEDSDSTDKHRLIHTFDPDGDHNPSGGNTGDYGLYYYKDYSNLSTGVKMGWDIYGAQDGFHWTINGDNNGGTNAYDRKPLYLTSGDITVNTRDAYNSTKETLHINKDMVQSKVPLNLKSYTVAEANALTNIDSGSLIWVSNGNAGAGTVAVYNGTDWKVLPYTNTIASS